MDCPLQQTLAWKKLQDDLGEETIFEKTDNYTILGIVKKSRFGSYLYLPYGPYLRDKNAANTCFKALESLAKTKNLIFIRIEPQLALNPLKSAKNEKTAKNSEKSDFTSKSLANLPKNAKKTTDLNPKETWRLDLTGSEDDLKSKLPSRLLRYYKNAEKKGLKIEVSKNPDDIRYLLDLQKALAAEKGISTFSEKYLKTELTQDFATLYLVKYSAPDINSPEFSQKSENSQKIAENPANSAKNSQKSEIIAAGLVFDDETTRYNLQGAQNDLGRKLHATGILTVKLILDAYEKHLKIFDFWGIAPENAPETHPWAGFTTFKKTFAGYEVDYTGTYDLIFNPKKYRLYEFARKANRTLRKFRH